MEWPRLEWVALARCALRLRAAWGCSMVEGAQCRVAAGCGQHGSCTRCAWAMLGSSATAERAVHAAASCGQHGSCASMHGPCMEAVRRQSAKVRCARRAVQGATTACVRAGCGQLCHRSTCTGASEVRHGEGACHDRLTGGMPSDGSVALQSSCWPPASGRARPQWRAHPGAGHWHSQDDHGRAEGDIARWGAGVFTSSGRSGEQPSPAGGCAVSLCISARTSW